MQVISFLGGYDRNFMYLVVDEKTRLCAVIDPFPEVDEALDYIYKNKLTLVYILNTHDHFDHTGGNNKLKKETGAKIVNSKLSAKQADIKVDDTDTIVLGDLKIKPILTPGHSKSDVCYLIKDCLFTGDVLFVGSVGGTGLAFPGSSIKQQFDSLQRIKTLDEKIKIFPGHDYGNAKTSTIQEEKKNNRFLKASTLEEFERAKY